MDPSTDSKDSRLSLTEGSEESSDISSSEEDIASKYTKDYNLHNYSRTTERIIDIPPPASHVLTDEEFFTSDLFPNIPVITDHLFHEGRIMKKHFMWLLEQTFDILCEERTVISVDAPITVCGDVHGQYYDLLKLLEVGGDPAETNYLFLGDYVDRGNFSVECVILLFCYKICYSESFFLLRGNHECRHLTEYFTFKNECKMKYDMEIYDSIMDCFDTLPLAAVMNRQFLCLHGGLSPEMHSIDDIAVIDRFTEPPVSGIMCDILWADPMENFSPDVRLHFNRNSLRGCSFTYSHKAVCEFLDKNKLLSIIRAHEAQDAGYCMHTKNDKTGFPALITLFSAPNYLNSYHNKGAVLRYENNIINIRQFNESPHPYFLPGFMNVFNWSLPFIADKVSDLIKIILSLVDDSEAEQKELTIEARRDALRTKLKTAGFMLTLLKTTRQQRDAKEKEISGKSSIQVETTPMSKDEIVHDKRPDGADAILERVRNEHLNTPIAGPITNSKVLRRQKTREKLILARDMITTPNWVDISGEKPTVHIDESSTKTTTNSTTTTTTTTTSPRK